MPTFKKERSPVYPNLDHTRACLADVVDLIGARRRTDKADIEDIEGERIAARALGLVERCCGIYQREQRRRDAQRNGGRPKKRSAAA